MKNSREAIILAASVLKTKTPIFQNNWAVPINPRISLEPTRTKSSKTKLLIHSKYKSRDNNTFTANFMRLNYPVTHLEALKNFFGPKDRKTRKTKIFEKKLQTYPADCPKIAAADFNKHDWDWKNRRYWKKKDFSTKIFFISNLFWWHFVVEHNELLFLRERLQGLLSIPNITD